MNKNLNPLTEFSSYTTFHILLAFQNSEDAYSYDFDRNFEKNGTIFDSGTGIGLIVLNELVDSSVSVASATTEWSFFSPNDHETSSYSGVMEFADRSGFRFTQSLKNFTEVVGMSITHLTFAWITIFTGIRTPSSPEETVTPKPMFFHVISFDQNISDSTGRAYYFDIVSAYNTHGISQQFSQLNQFTINHKDGNTINSIPTPISPSKGIESTAKEDAKKLISRKTRLQKTKYMKTIDDVAKGMEVALNDQKNNHKRQLQRFMSLIVDDYTEKFSGVKPQIPLPIDYTINIAPYYKDKKIDNINLPFEQFEIDQNVFGISSMTFPSSYSLHRALSVAMKMSKDVGKDHLNIPTRTYKFTTVSKRKPDGNYLIHTNVNDFISPYNGDDPATDPNTGPGNGIIDQPIEYTYQDIGGTLADDNSVYSITYSAIPNIQLMPLEIASDAQDAQAVLGDREAMTNQRVTPYASFFENASSGIRALRGLMVDNGVQNPEAAAAISAFNPTQQIKYTLGVIGNPHLLSDINRNPQAVISGLSEGAIIYKNVEYEPMYLKLKIYLAGEQLIRDTGTFYYDGFLHIYKITNIFTPGQFSQKIYCARTNDKM